MQKLLKYLYFFLIIIIFFTPVKAEIDFPKLTGRIVDNAEIIDDKTEKELITLIEQEDKRAGNEIVIATLKTLQDYEISDYGYQLGRHWGVGKKDKDNGIILIVAPQERKVRIEVGTGLEPIITDFRSKMIIEYDIIPSFKAGNMQAGIVKGTKKIIEHLKEGVPKEDEGKNKNYKYEKHWYDNITLLILALLYGPTVLYIIAAYVLSFIKLKVIADLFFIFLAPYFMISYLLSVGSWRLLFLALGIFMGLKNSSAFREIIETKLKPYLPPLELFNGKGSGSTSSWSSKSGYSGSSSWSSGSSGWSSGSSSSWSSSSSSYSGGGGSFSGGGASGSW